MIFNERMTTFMAKLTPDEIKRTKVGGKIVAEWDKEWEPLANAFSQDHPELRQVIGLVRIKLNGMTTYIVRATELRGGIAKGLRRISGPDQTGNLGYGAQMIRQHINQVEAEILRVQGGRNPSQVTKELKREMNRLYDPLWAIPSKRRMQMIRDGLLHTD